MRNQRHIDFIGYFALLGILLAFAPRGMAQEESYPVPPEAELLAGVPQGKIEGPFKLSSQVYPGTERDYWLYVPAQYDAAKPACTIIV